MDLLTAAHTGDPVLDVALSHALLRAVAAGTRGPTLRVFRPEPTAAFGRLDALRPGFSSAVAAARRRGLRPLVRHVGGHAAIYDERCVIVEHVSAEGDVTARMQDRFVEGAEHIRCALTALGADARVGELPREYCPGAHSINVAGRAKLAGIAQRVIRGGALTSAVIVAGGGPDLRAAIAEIYRALELDVDPANAGAVDEWLPGVTAEQIATAVVETYAADEPLTRREPDERVLAAARTLAARHRPTVPP